MNLIVQMFRVYAEVACFKRSPKDTPSSSLMLGVAAFMVVLMTLLQLSLVFEFNLTSTLFWSQFFFVLFDLVALAGFMSAVLFYIGNFAEFKRMLSAWLMFVVFINFGFCLIMSMVLVLKGYAFVRILFMLLTLGFSLWSVVFMLNLFRIFFTPVVWKAALFYLTWMLIHFGLVTAFKWVV